ncbi:flagellar filament capping protein FliD [Marinicrinis lubricantis]|uniref:Flagellar hook-associated protein 2 n=1 Tax=Marinicrinis lubricantis TaxID=2086470 RepID=A0ABW1ISY3_9BACL
MVLRMSGLASGMDTESIVQQLMSAHKIPVTKLEQKQQIVEWKQEDYRNMNTKILEFRNYLFDGVILGNPFDAQKANLSGDTSAVSVNASSTATGSLSIQVKELAKAATKNSYGSITAGLTSFSAGEKLSTQMTGLNSTYSFKVNGKEFTVNTAEESLNDVISKINKDSDANVSVFFDDSSGKLSFVAKEAGEVNGVGGNLANITFEDTSGDFLQKVLKINNYTEADGATDPDTNNATVGNKATVVINGMETTRNTNTFSINGMDITLLKEGGGTATVEVGKDIDKIVENIKQFMTKYNETLNLLTSKVNEERHKDYEPLTDDQRKEFKESGYDIDEWTSLARSGLIRNDSILKDAINDMRSAITTLYATGSEYNSLASIGVETTRYSKNSDVNGNLVIDEDKLRKALQENPDAVEQIFLSKGTAADGSDKGVIEKMYQNLKQNLDDLTSKAGNPNASTEDTSTLGNELYNLKSRLVQMNNRLVTLENNYYKQFSTMEQVISNYNSQSAYLTNAFA